MKMQGGSLSQRLIAPIRRTLILALLAFSFGAVAYTYFAFETKLGDRLDHVANLAKSSLPYSVWNLDDEAVQGIINALFQDEAIVYVALAADGEITQFRIRPAYEGKDFSYFQRSFGFAAKAVDLVHKGQNIGSVRIALSKEDLFNQLILRVIGIIALAALLSALISYHFVRLAENLILSPLRQLEGSAAAIAEGNLEAEIDTDSDDEIGGLARSLDTMRGSIQGLVANLKEQNAALERKVIERTEELRHSTARYRQLFRGNKAVQLLIDPEDGSIVDANEAAAQFYGYTVGELKDRKVSDINIHSKEAIAERMANAKAEEKSCFFVQHRLASGEIRDVEVHSGPLQVDGRTILYSIIHDITERKEAEEALAERTEELARSNKDLEQFAYVASHDLQEPLRMVTSYLQLLDRKFSSELSEEALEYMDFAVEGGKRMSLLINDLLAYSRVTSRREEPLAVDMEEIVRAVVGNLGKAVKDAGATIHLGTLPKVTCDRTQLTSLFQNLIGNAVKYHKVGTKPEITVGAVQEKDGWHFTVADNGIGIAPDYAEKIFVIFQRLHHREDYEGTGIGLAICKKIVELHGGHIWVESQEGKGAAFHFTLPEQHFLPKKGG